MVVSRARFLSNLRPWTERRVIDSCKKVFRKRCQHRRDFPQRRKAGNRINSDAIRMHFQAISRFRGNGANARNSYIVRVYARTISHTARTDVRVRGRDHE